MRVLKLYHLNIPHEQILHLLSRDAGNVFLPFEIKILFQERRYYAFLYQIKLFIHTQEWTPYFLKAMLNYIWSLTSLMALARCPKLIDCIFDLLAAMTAFDHDKPKRVEEFIKIIAKRHVDKAIYIRDHIIGDARPSPAAQQAMITPIGKNAGMMSSNTGVRNSESRSSVTTPSQLSLIQQQQRLSAFFSPIPAPAPATLAPSSSSIIPQPVQPQPSRINLIAEERELRIARGRVLKWSESETPLIHDPATNAFTYMYDIEVNIMDYASTYGSDHSHSQIGHNTSSTSIADGSAPSSATTGTGTAGNPVSNHINLLHSSAGGKGSLTDLFKSYLLNEAENYYSFYHDFRVNLTGVFLLYYIGEKAFYRGLLKASLDIECPVFIGKADHNMRDILLEIAMKIHHAKDLHINDFVIRMVLVKDFIYAPLLETAYIKEFQPLWNSEICMLAFDQAKGSIASSHSTAVTGNGNIGVPNENSHNGHSSHNSLQESTNVWDWYHIKQDSDIIRKFHQQYCEDPMKKDYRPLYHSSTKTTISASVLASTSSTSVVVPSATRSYVPNARSQDITSSSFHNAKR
jgi:hypothetical protein